MQPDLSFIKEAFIKGKIPLLIGYSGGMNNYTTRPRIFKDASLLDELVFDCFSNHNLAAYILEAKVRPIGIMVKPCDGKAIVELIRENKVARENIMIFSLSCKGIIDLKKLFALKERETEFITEVKVAKDKIEVRLGKRVVSVQPDTLLENKCLKCTLKHSPVYDYTNGEALPLGVKDAEPVNIGKTEKDKRAFWLGEYSRCIRCGACRNVCPMCYCPDCVLERKPPRLVNKEVNARENGAFLMIRAMHLAGRCCGCERCSQVCPVSINHENLHFSLSKYILKTFGFEPGKDVQKPPLLSEAKMDEKEDFSDGHDTVI